MSHTASCERDEHHEEAVGHGDLGARADGRPAFGLLDPEPSTIRRQGTRRAGLLTLPELRWALVSFALFLVGLVVTAVSGPTWLLAMCFAGCYASGGWEPGLAGLRALRHRTLDVDLLMVAAAIGAAAIGQALDGALLIVIFSTSGALEAVATKRTQDSVRSLLKLAPEQATRIRADIEEQVDTAVLVVGDVILVRPGERIGADGVVIDGASEVDQASITGEPLPVFRLRDDEVFAGSLNGAGVLHVRVAKPAAESVVARIVALVEDAGATKAKTQLFIERIEQRYSVGMVCATLVLFVVPIVLGDGLRPTLLRAMTFMIVASPCAVVLATMPPLLAAIANAGRHGVLVKSAVVMEQLGVTTQVAFDKTGTLTEGTPQVADIHVINASISEAEVLRLAAGAEHLSEHPLGRAVVAAAVDHEIAIPPADGFVSTPGRGVTARVERHDVRVGSPTLLGAELDDISREAARRQVDAVEDAGRTAVVVFVDGSPVGVLGLGDQLRPHASATVAALERLTGTAPLLLTGDNHAAARRLGEEVGITDVRAGLLPQDKLMVVRTLQDGGGHLLVVGDGVNDAPALAAAHVGVAMGRHGSDLALETADAVVVRDDLDTIPAVIDISQRARRIVTANLAFAGTVIVSLVVLDLLGHLPLPLGVAGHEGSTVVVGLNGLRLLRGRAWRADPTAIQ
jgi:heavy metal translocating P-type ATPase